MSRLEVVRAFYDLLDTLRDRTGGPFILGDCNGRLAWPSRGVYFFFEEGESRSDSGQGDRVVRVGTHALGEGASSTLWGRLALHAGSRSAIGGNHRGSIFRLLVGEAMKQREGREEPRSWGVGGDAGTAARRFACSRDEVKAAEMELEQAVSRYIGAMPFLFVAVEDDAGPASARGRIERGAIALLSNYGRPVVDTPSKSWLGHWSGRDRVRQSGLWNNNHVDEPWGAEFVETLAGAVNATARLKIEHRPQS